jgi:hypothetical protein
MHSCVGGKAQLAFRALPPFLQPCAAHWRRHSSARALREWRRTGVGRCALACARAGARLHRRREVATPGFSQLGSQRKQRRDAFGLRNEIAPQRRVGFAAFRPRLGPTVGFRWIRAAVLRRRRVLFEQRSQRVAAHARERLSAQRQHGAVTVGCGRKARADPKPPPHRTERAAAAAAAAPPAAPRRWRSKWERG